jgi:regulator of protease activity HflC (stomatin/prohibitin superfamily)
MTGIEIIAGVGLGLTAYILLRALMLGFFTVAPNERAVLTSFGRAQRIGKATTLDTPLADDLPEADRERYCYPQLHVIGPGGPYFRWPWQKVYKVNVAISTASIAFDPETPEANQGGLVLEAVTQDQLNIGLSGQIRFSVSEGNLYAFLFGVKKPIAHVMGYFISILRERIANFKAPRPDESASSDDLRFEGISINDLRKNVNLLNEQMDTECRSSAARYGRHPTAQPSWSGSRPRCARSVSASCLPPRPLRTNPPNRNAPSRRPGPPRPRGNNRSR